MSSDRTATFTVEPVAVDPTVAFHMLNCGRTHGYELIAAGELESYLDGRSRKITVASVHAYVARQLARERLRQQGKG
jgi:excisionase family DNA binding protein